ncbi:sugar kinase [Brucella intermedia]|uniref:Ribokinase-like domain-containing protein n=2 Tax=Brucella intermedia TaxID=94625 RepID=C4WFU8_9HYPH|nr:MULTISPECIES: sugar kinase [Brucella]PJT23510.1 sugar kinase [Ochrobactrum sp. 30A/1000/2015]PJT38017.1 sugar kinase [Ochrobactrum sp. 27A/999/2015]PJT41550.1 sugar kinase [Ochrobactrum sp. 23A/997/2015]EEQ95476.1 ribokinase-like domain-containing protein [Brucella intermedia LMG 3301]ELT47170.1 ribokinase-like domain-containing protein [Brucella intermedia M86]
MMPQQFRRPAVLSIGRIYCDLIFTGLQSLPQPGREVFAENMKMAAGGGAFISAAHLAHAGRAVALVARLGFDGLSRGLEPDLKIDGVDLRFLERADDAGPQVTVASVIGNDRAFLSRRAGSALPTTLSAALQWKDAGHLHIAEFATLHEIPDLVRQAKAAGLSVSLDPSWDDARIHDPSLLAACEGVDIFLPNREEAQAITGYDDPAKALDALAVHFPVVALKGGGEGAWLRTADSNIHMAAKDVPVVDTTGAGDAFNAGFIDSWLEGHDVHRALAAGIEYGSLAVQAAGGASILRSPDRLAG